MEEEMNKQNEESTVHTEFSKQIEAFAREVSGKMDDKNTKKGFILLSIDQSEKKTDLFAAIIGNGKLLSELIMRAMDSNEDLRRILEISVKGLALYSMCKKVLNIEK